MTGRVELDALLTSNEGNWTFIGDSHWRQDRDGMIYPPVWQQEDFDPEPTQVPKLYAHELAREDYAILAHQPLSDTDVSVQYKCPYGSVIHGGIMLRAVDSARCYVLDISDLWTKGQEYELTLWLQEASGYRKALASGRAPHSVVPERIVRGGTRTREDWNISSPDWVTVRVQASKDLIQVSMDGRMVFEARDRTYAAGCTGLVARGSVMFRKLTISGERAELPATWARHEGELPRFFEPGGEPPLGFNAYPVVCRTRDGAVLVAWIHGAGLSADLATEKVIVMTRSQDEGLTWSPPRPVFDPGGLVGHPASLFAHRDGSLSCVMQLWPRKEDWLERSILVIRSSDGGETWSAVGPLLAGGRALASFECAYSPMQRLSDGTVVFCRYEDETTDACGEEVNAGRLDRSLFFRSEDDGRTWEAPIVFDEENFDHNECLVAEVGPGRLAAFMRTLGGDFRTSRSEDSGKTWTTPAAHPNMSSRDHPHLLRHSSGALVMCSRGLGTFMKLSFDDGESWTNAWRISPASAIVGMTELSDGRVLIVIPEGYRTPGRVRGQFFRVTEEGPVPAE